MRLAIVTLEEHMGRNGLKAIINNIITGYSLAKKVLSFSLPDEFIHTVGSQTYLRKQFGLTSEEIGKRIKEAINCSGGFKKIDDGCL